jgi:hypothetical protein
VKDFLLNNDKLFSDMIDAIIKIYDVASEGGDATEAKAQLEALVGQLGARTTRV